MKKTPSLAIAVAVAAATLSLASAACLRGAQDGTFTGVVGNWKNADDGGPAFKVDTTGWSGTTPRPTLEALSKSLFGTAATETFLANGTSAAAFPLAVFNGTTNFTQGTVRVQFKLVGGASDQTAGIVFNLKPTGEYYFARYNTKDGNLAVWQYRNGNRARLHDGEMHVQLPMNTWHELAMTVTGNKLTTTLDGNVLK